MEDVLTLLHGYFSGFLNYAHGTKSRNAPHMGFKNHETCLLIPG